MSISIIQVPPEKGSPSNNYIWFMIDPTSSYSGMTNYYTQFQIIDESNNTLIKNNVKVYDNVWNGNALYDAHKVLNNYVSYETLPLEGTVGFYSSENSIMKYSMLVNEYTGSTLLSTSTIYSGFTLNAVVDTKDLTNGAYFDYTPYVMTATTYGKFLSPWIGNRYVRPNDFYSLAFLQTFGVSKVDTAYLTVTKPDGSTVNYTLENTISTTATTDHICYLGCGPYEIDQTNWSGNTGNVHNAITNNSAVSYTIYVGTKTSRLSEIVTFIVDRNCRLIDDVELIWLNKLGSYDAYTFYREQHTFLNSEKTTYTKNNFSMDSNYIVQKDYDRGETVLSNKVQKSMTLKSKILDNNMSKNVASVFQSNNVYLNIYDGSTYELVPVKIDLDSLEIQNNYNRPERVIYSFNVTWSNDENTMQ